MRKFLIAAHGSFSSGIKTSLDLIIGETENIFILNAYVNGNRSIEEDLNSIMKHIQPYDELIVFSDLLGGSVTNQILQFALKENVYVVSGVNLPLVIDVILADPETPAEAVIDAAIENAKQQITYVNRILNKGVQND